MFTYKMQFSISNVLNCMYLIKYNFICVSTFKQSEYQNDQHLEESLTQEKMRTLGTWGAMERTRRLVLKPSRAEIQGEILSIPIQICVSNQKKNAIPVSNKSYS